MAREILAALGGVLLTGALWAGDGAEQELRDLQRRVTELEGRVAAADEAGTLASDWRVTWSKGLRFESPQGRDEVAIGGRIMNDWSFFHTERGVARAFGNFEDGTEFRRARLYVSGLIHDHVEFKAQYDFAGGDADFKDVYLGLVDVPVVGKLRVGHFKEPFGLQTLTSSKYISLMERSLIETFAPSRNTGFMIHHVTRDGRATAAIGAFRTTGSDGDGSGDGSYSFTGRMTGTPIYRHKGRQLLHLGAAYSVRNPAGSQVRYESDPGMHEAPDVVDTGVILNARTVHVAGIEGAIVLGPFSVQGEAVLNHVDRDNGARDLDFSAAYVQASWFLTGEHRKYKKGKFGRVSPRRDLLEDGRGPGALELVGRWSTLDLDDGGIAGGDVDRSFSSGLNWYLNPNARVMFNHVLSELDAGRAQAAMVRFQIDF